MLKRVVTLWLHHLLTHSPIWIGRHTGQAQCPLLLLSGDRLRDRGKVFGALAFLTEGDEENFSFAVFKNQVGNAIRRLHGSFCHQPDIVGWVAVRCLSLCVHRFEYLLECMALRISKELLALMGHLL
jgi:hypothetical protein